MMATEIGINVSSVQRIWRAHGLQPHRIRQLRLSKDPKLVENLRDVVGYCPRPTRRGQSNRLLDGHGHQALKST